MNKVNDQIASLKAKNEAILKAQDAEIQKLQKKAEALEAYNVKQEELNQMKEEMKAIAETFHNDFGSDVEVELGLKAAPKTKGKKADDGTSKKRNTVVITEQQIETFVAAIEENPDISREKIQILVNLKIPTVKKIKRAYENTNHNLGEMKKILQVV